MRISPMGAELFQEDGRMEGRIDITKLNSSFLPFRERA